MPLRILDEEQPRGGPEDSTSLGDVRSLKAEQGDRNNGFRLSQRVIDGAFCSIREVPFTINPIATALEKSSITINGKLPVRMADNAPACIKETLDQSRKVRKDDYLQIATITPSEGVTYTDNYRRADIHGEDSLKDLRREAQGHVTHNSHDFKLPVGYESGPVGGSNLKFPLGCIALSFERAILRSDTSLIKQLKDTVTLRRPHYNLSLTITLPSIAESGEMRIEPRDSLIVITAAVKHPQAEALIRYLDSGIDEKSLKKTLETPQNLSSFLNKHAENLERLVHSLLSKANTTTDLGRILSWIREAIIPVITSRTLDNEHPSPRQEAFAYAHLPLIIPGDSPPQVPANDNPLVNKLKTFLDAVVPNTLTVRDTTRIQSCTPGITLLTTIDKQTGTLCPRVFERDSERWIAVDCGRDGLDEISCSAGNPQLLDAIFADTMRRYSGKEQKTATQQTGFICRKGLITFCDIDKRTIFRLPSFKDKPGYRSDRASIYDEFIAAAEHFKAGGTLDTVSLKSQELFKKYKLTLGYNSTTKLLYLHGA